MEKDLERRKVNYFTKIMDPIEINFNINKVKCIIQS